MSISDYWKCHPHYYSGRPSRASGGREGANAYLELKFSSNKGLGYQIGSQELIFQNVRFLDVCLFLKGKHRITFGFFEESRVYQGNFINCCVKF